MRFSWFVCVALCASPLCADSIETKNGARLVGTIEKIEDGKITLATDYAGKLEVKQSEVAALTTDQPIAVRLGSGTRIDGRISTSAPRAGATGGSVQIAGADGAVTTSLDQLAASWTAGRPDPYYARDWSYEASVDVSGKSGNSDQLGTQGDLRATLKSVQDTLLFFASYNRQETDGAKAADQLKAGVDYQNNFKGRNAWYLRDEGGFDRVKDIELYNIAAAGYGFDVIKEPKHTLTGRFGLSFRYEGYRNPVTEDVKSLGLDIGFNNEMEFATSKLVNRVSYVPSFDDFANYRFTHESFYQIPLTHPAWKLRLGVSNDYNSKPPVGVEKLDTSYFTRLVLNWK